MNVEYCTSVALKIPDSVTTVTYTDTTTTATTIIRTMATTTPEINKTREGYNESVIKHFLLVSDRWTPGFSPG